MRSSGIQLALWLKSMDFYFKLKNQTRAASKRPIVWKRHSKGIFVAYVHTSSLLHYFFSFKALDGLTLYGLQLCLMAPTQYIPFQKSRLHLWNLSWKNLSSERSNPTLPSLGINVVSSIVQICITSCQIWKWLSAAENTC